MHDYTPERYSIKSWLKVRGTEIGVKNKYEVVLFLPEEGSFRNIKSIISSWKAVLLHWTSFLCDGLWSFRDTEFFHSLVRSEQVLCSLEGETWGTISLDINQESAWKYLFTIAMLEHHFYDWMNSSSLSQCTGERCESENECEWVGNLPCTFNKLINGGIKHLKIMA